MSGEYVTEMGDVQNYVGHFTSLTPAAQAVVTALGGGANQALSNLAAVAVNTNIDADADPAHFIGLTNRFRAIRLKSGSDGTPLDIEAGSAQSDPLAAFTSHLGTLGDLLNISSLGYLGAVQVRFTDQGQYPALQVGASNITLATGANTFLTVGGGGSVNLRANGSAAVFRFETTAFFSYETADLGQTGERFRRVYVSRVAQRSSSAADPSITEYPSDNDWGIHKNATSGNVFLAYNDGGAIVKVQLT